MRKWVKTIALLAAAPVVWLSGELLLLAVPADAYVVEHSPLHVSQADVSAQEVADLNDRLQGDGVRLWRISFAVSCTAEDVMLVVPTTDGGLELLQVRPFCAWREGEESARRRQVLESWLRDRQGKGDAE